MQPTIWLLEANQTLLRKPGLYVKITLQLRNGKTLPHDLKVRDLFLIVGVIWLFYFYLFI